MSDIPCEYCNHKDDTEENGCDIHYHKFKCEKYSVYLDGRADAIEEALQIIHNTYTQDLHCMADMCDRDNQGYDCEDCLYKSIKQNLEQLKEQSNEIHQRGI